MEVEKRDKEWFERLEQDGLLLDQMSSLGWAFWPCKEDGSRIGFLDERALRKLADEIERRNKPFWDDYFEAERRCVIRDHGHDETGQFVLDFSLDKPSE